MSIKETLIKELQSLEICNGENAPQYVVRCPFCGDSTKQYEHGHLSILIDANSNSAIIYRCFRCNESGLFNNDTLRLMNIGDRDIGNQLLAYNKVATKKMKKNLGYKRDRANIYVPIADVNNRTRRKMNYVNNRLGLNLTPSEMSKHKIILDFKAFCVYNDIEKFHVSNGILNMLNDNYVGFLTVNNESIVFRAIGKAKIRYFKYKIFGEIFTQSFYTIPSQVDLMSNIKTVIHISEGTFDIMGVKHNIEETKGCQNMYIAVCSSDFLGAIKYIISNGVIDNFSIRIYSDNEKNRQLRFYEGLKRELSIWTKDIKVFYNTKSKDCGVPKEFISLQGYKL